MVPNAFSLLYHLAALFPIAAFPKLVGHNWPTNMVGYIGVCPFKGWGEGKGSNAIPRITLLLRDKDSPSPLPAGSASLWGI